VGVAIPPPAWEPLAPPPPADAEGDAAPPPQGRAWIVVAAVVVLTLSALGAFVWIRGRSTAYVPPPRTKPAPLAIVSSTSGSAQGVTTAAAPVRDPAPSAALASGTAPRAPSARPADIAVPASAPSVNPSAPSRAPGGSAPAAAPAASASRPASEAPSAASGTVTVPPSRGGHRVWVDKQIVGESPGTFTVRCGVRSIRVGSQGQLRNIDVPCGGDVEVR
jgi:hypothetical protein